MKRTSAAIVMMLIITACLHAGGNVKTSLTGSCAVYWGKGSSNSEVTGSDYRMIGAGGGFSVSGSIPSGLAFYAGISGSCLPEFTHGDKSYHDYKKESKYWGEMLEISAGAGKEFRISDRFRILAGGGLCFSRVFVDIDFPVLNIAGNYRLEMLNFGLSARGELNYRFHDNVSLVLAVDVSAYAYNITTAKEIIAPPAGTYCLYRKDVRVNGWALGAGIRGSLGIASFF